MAAGIDDRFTGGRPCLSAWRSSWTCFSFSFSLASASSCVQGKGCQPTIILFQFLVRSTIICLIISNIHE
jgi:hypothetical protein